MVQANAPLPTPCDAGELDQEVVFLFLGGPHQVLHLAPVAAELSKFDAFPRVTAIYDRPSTKQLLRDVKARLHAPLLRLEHAKVPPWGKWLAWLGGQISFEKLPRLVRLSTRIKSALAVVTPERTSSALRLLRVNRPLLIHFRHGAGDRAPSSEAKIHRFDLIVVPGDKDYRHAVEELGVPPEKLRRTGYVKLEYLNEADRISWHPFASGRPLVIYNPHFDLKHSSWHMAREIVEAFRVQERFDFALIPHIRVAENMPAAERRGWESLAVPGHIAIDLGSPKLFDMSWLNAADVYLGDMSSQLYEFLARPRPVAFINAHDVNWQNDLKYAGWHLGEVARGGLDVVDAVARAIQNHAEKATMQEQAVAYAYGQIDGAARLSAEVVADYLGSMRGQL